MVLRRNHVCVRLHISAAATGNAGLCVAAVVAAALGHVNDLPSRACAQSLWLFLQYLGFVTVGGFEHLANRAICRTVPGRLGGIVSSFGCCLEWSLAAVIGTTLGCLNMPDPRLMCGAEVQSQQQEFQPAGRAFQP